MILNMTKWKSPNEVNGFLLDVGYEKVDEGGYSEIFSIPGDNTIVKISVQQDRCWFKFAEWVMKQKIPNKNLPKIYSLRQYEANERSFFISRIEKLNLVEDYYDNLIHHPGKEKDPRKVAFVLWLQAIDGIEYLLDDDRIIRSLSKSSLRKRQQFRGLSTRDIIVKMVNNFKRTNLHRTVTKINTEVLSRNMKMCFSDLHTGNFMERDDGTLVIIDPIGED